MPPNEHGPADAGIEEPLIWYIGRLFFFMNQTIYKMAGREDPFARVPKALLDDERISWQAKGILAYLVGKKDGWKMRVADLVKRGTAGEHAVRAALKELRIHGYAQCVCHRGEGGKIGEWVWKVSDSPIFSPDGGFPHLDDPHLENRDSNKKDSRKKSGATLVSQETKETKETSAVADAVVFDAEWKPNAGTKLEKLRKLRTPTDYPSEREFDALLEAEGLDDIVTYRPDLYSTLCNQKWHQWKDGLRKWVAIRHWQAYVAALNNTLCPGGGF